jgi:hypothetical protein
VAARGGISREIAMYGASTVGEKNQTFWCRRNSKFQSNTGALKGRLSIAPATVILGLDPRTEGHAQLVDSVAFFPRKRMLRRRRMNPARYLSDRLTQL